MPSAPDDLADRLARRSCPEPAADFRARVLRAMAEARRGPTFWPLLRRLAVAAVVALNLGMAASNALRFQQFDSAGVAPAPDAGPLASRLFTDEGDREWVTH